MLLWNLTSFLENFDCDALRDLVLFAQFKKRKNTHGEVLFLIKLQAKAWDLTNGNTPPWVFSTFFNLYK